MESHKTRVKYDKTLFEINISKNISITIKVFFTNKRIYRSKNFHLQLGVYFKEYTKLYTTGKKRKHAYVLSRYKKIHANFTNTIITS